jgi:hypothetical protein
VHDSEVRERIVGRKVDAVGGRKEGIYRRSERSGRVRKAFYISRMSYLSEVLGEDLREHTLYDSVFAASFSMNLFMRTSCSSSSRASGSESESESEWAGYLKAFRRRVVGSIVMLMIAVAFEL